MAFKGMDPDAGRTVAEAIKKAGTDIQEVFDQLTGQITGVEWIGPDFDTYVSDWNSFISGSLTSVVDGFTTKGEDLNTQAEEQDTTSNNG
ncbi:WXG100 family type VII secretion target [Brachybacterium huguangmaarense]